MLLADRQISSTFSTSGNVVGVFAHLSHNFGVRVLLGLVVGGRELTVLAFAKQTRIHFSQNFWRTGNLNGFYFFFAILYGRPAALSFFTTRSYRIGSGLDKDLWRVSLRQVRLGAVCFCVRRRLPGPRLDVLVLIYIIIT